MIRQYADHIFSGAFRARVPRSEKPLRFSSLKISENRLAFFDMKARGAARDDDQTISLLAIKNKQLIFDYSPQNIHSSQSIMLFTLTEFVLHFLEMLLLLEKHDHDLCFNGNSWAKQHSQDIELRTGRPRLHELYHWGNYHLGGFSQVYASGKSLSNCSFDKLWNPLGMESAAYWNIVQAERRFIPHKYVMSASARDICKLVHVAVSGGVAIDGRRVLPKAYADVLVQSLGNASVRNSSEFVASSSYGNIIFFSKAKRILFLRLGTGYSKTSAQQWIKLMSDLSMYR